MSRWFLFFLAIAIGAAGGLIYGWWVAPVEYYDATLDALHQDYKTDYVLMVAEAYKVENNLSLAAQRLALLGSDAPEEMVGKALLRASENKYSTSDLILIKVLQDSLMIWNPSIEAPPP